MVIFQKLEKRRGFKIVPVKFSNLKLYSIRELEKILSITPLIIREYLRKGKIKGHKIGKKWYVTKENLEAFLLGKGIEG